MLFGIRGKLKKSRCSPHLILVTSIVLASALLFQELLSLSFQIIVYICQHIPKLNQYLENIS
jgi:hypothetical protein